jgi:hypothetical protein
MAVNDVLEIMPNRTGWCTLSYAINVHEWD